eukprot:4077551-Pleurochrysis_carterae.AAC.3
MSPRRPSHRARFLDLARSDRRRHRVRCAGWSRDRGANLSRCNGRAVPGQRPKKYPSILMPTLSWIINIWIVYQRGK